MVNVEKEDKNNGNGNDEERMIVIPYNFQEVPDFLRDSPGRIKTWIQGLNFLPETVRERLVGMTSEIEEESTSNDNSS